LALRVLVCVKRVPAPGARINVTTDAMAVDTAHLGFTTSPHEECAVEAAVQLVEQHGGASTVLTLGPREAEEQLRYAASVGVSSAVLLPAVGDVDPQRTAAAIAAAVRQLEDRDAPFDLILFGNESADACGFQVGVRVATALGRPIVNGAKGLSVADGAAAVERPSDAGRERFVLPLPAVVGVKEGINLPRYPTLKGRLASKKLAVETIDVVAPAGALTMTRLRAPVEQSAPATTILGRGPEASRAVVELLVELGLA
jgi:electron transfer flavoprotein beta subunit